MSKDISFNGLENEFVKKFIIIRQTSVDRLSCNADDGNNIEYESSYGLNESVLNQELICTKCKKKILHHNGNLPETMITNHTKNHLTGYHPILLIDNCKYCEKCDDFVLAEQKSLDLSHPSWACQKCGKEF